MQHVKTKIHIPVHGNLCIPRTAVEPICKFPILETGKTIYFCHITSGKKISLNTFDSLAFYYWIGMIKDLAPDLLYTI